LGAWRRCCRILRRIVSKARGDKVGVCLRALGCEVDTVLPDEFGVACAFGLPIDEHRVLRVSLHLVGQHGVIRHFDGVRYAGRDRRVHYQHLTHPYKHPHHLAELFWGEGAVVAYVHDHSVPELTGSEPPAEDVDGGRGLAAALRIDEG
jgi:hypothetical protein